MKRPSEHEFLYAVLHGEPYAVALCEALFTCSQVLDDCYDEGVPAHAPAVLDLGYLAFVTLPENPFYQRHFTRLQPRITDAMRDWLTATELEQGNAHDRSLAFVLRDTLTGVVIEAARIVGGDDHARAQAARIRRFFHDEALPRYLQGLLEE